jgi:uncharacterized protein Yka (UPF0111/DUF47 family)
MIIRKRNIFIQLIHQQASQTLVGMDNMKAFFSRPDQSIADKLTEKENEADESHHFLIDELNRNFITPFDCHRRNGGKIPGKPRYLSGSVSRRIC